MSAKSKGLRQIVRDGQRLERFVGYEEEHGFCEIGGMEGMAGHDMQRVSERQKLREKEEGINKSQ